MLSEETVDAAFSPGNLDTVDTLLDLAEFRSPRFTPALPEACQVNPGVYGAELAFWLGAELARESVVTGYPEWEDWGWYVEYTTARESEFAVHCANVDGTNDRWRLSLRRFGRKLFGRDKPPFSEAVALVGALRTVLEREPSVTELEWLASEGRAER